MAGLDPAICRGTALGYYPQHGAATDGRVKPGHDGWGGRCRYVKHFAGWYYLGARAFCIGGGGIIGVAMTFGIALATGGAG